MKGIEDMKFRKERRLMKLEELGLIEQDQYF